MDLTLTREQEDFRDNVRSFLDKILSSELRAEARATTTVFAEYELAMRWQRLLHQKGWLAYQWPAEHGGTGWDPIRRYIFEKECALADAPTLPVMGLVLLGPVLHNFGSDFQQKRYLNKILSGEHFWCQGFSEPGAGSDLASLKTRAVKEGEHYVINGSKIWTTQAHFASHMFCLARTDPDAKAQRGISFFLIDINQPGVEIKPILGLAGEREVNAVFLDNVIVPVSDLVGGEGQGWTIAKFLLENERAGSCYAPALLVDVARIHDMARSEPSGGNGPLIADKSFSEKLARIELDVQSLEITELRNLCERASGGNPKQSSLVKIIASSLRQEVNSLQMELFAYSGLQHSPLDVEKSRADPDANWNEAARISARKYLNCLACTIFGGTNEIQKNIIAKTVLGL